MLATHLASPLKSLSDLAQSYGDDRAQKAIDTFESQIFSFTEGIEAWWQWVKRALQAETPDKIIQNWMLMALLPWVYWSEQVDKTRQPTLKYAINKLLAVPMTCS